MQMSRVPSDLADRLHHQFVSFAWDQWSQMGVSGHTERRDRWSIDPEALFAFTLRVARRDPRLFDEVLDWMCLNLDLMSAQRLRNLASDEETERLTSAALSWASTHSTKITRHRPPPTRELEEPDPLFVHSTGPMQVLRPDPVFLRYGFVRPQLKPSHKSRPPVRSAPINFSFRVRDLFGVSARAEVVRVLLLLHGRESRTREIVRAAGYSRQNVYEALNALVSAGVVIIRQRGPRDRSYALDQGRWAAFLGVAVDDLPDFVEWPRLLEVLWMLLTWVESLDTKEPSDYMRASEARQFVADHEIDLQSLGVRLPDGRRFLGADYWAPFEALVVDALTQRLEPAPEGIGAST
jgi:DNA-binding transcriptional ArsR family regulator